ncbi:MAG: VOC family protein, partial [Christiangramia sp.]|nr:VOC family protein [Christiangramia sp.]
DDQGEWKFHENQYIYISVPDLGSLRDRMKKSDCRFLGEIEEMPWGETLFYANDPFGNPICFVDEKTVFTGN